MVGAMPEDKDFAITWQIMELGRYLNALSRWSFIKKWKAKRKLDALRLLAFSYGFERALEELEDAGLLKKSI